MYAHSGCVAAQLAVYLVSVCVCVSLERVVVICPASTHTALVSSPSLTVLFTFLPTYLQVLEPCTLTRDVPRALGVGGERPGGRGPECSVVAVRCCSRAQPSGQRPEARARSPEPVHRACLYVSSGSRPIHAAEPDCSSDFTFSEIHTHILYPSRHSLLPSFGSDIVLYDSLCGTTAFHEAR